MSYTITKCDDCGVIKFDICFKCFTDGLDDDKSISHFFHIKTCEACKGEPDKDVRSNLSDGRISKYPRRSCSKCSTGRCINFIYETASSSYMSHMLKVISICP